MLREARETRMAFERCLFPGDVGPRQASSAQKVPSRTPASPPIASPTGHRKTCGGNVIAWDVAENTEHVSAARFSVRGGDGGGGRLARADGSAEDCINDNRSARLGVFAGILQSMKTAQRKGTAGGEGGGCTIYA